MSRVSAKALSGEDVLTWQLPQPRIPGLENIKLLVLAFMETVYEDAGREHQCAGRSAMGQRRRCLPCETVHWARRVDMEPFSPLWCAEVLNVDLRMPVRRRAGR